jgi:hypothetical protein
MTCFLEEGRSGCIAVTNTPQGMNATLRVQAGSITHIELLLECRPTWLLPSSVSNYFIDDNP